MRIAFLDCFAGISGDMFLGALIDAGVPLKILQDTVSSLKIGASLSVQKADRSGISCTRVAVLEEDRPAEQNVRMDADHIHSEERAHHSHEHHHHHHHVEHHHHHDEHGHHKHGRSLSSIRSLIQSAKLTDAVKQTAIRAFELLGASEAKIHNVDIEQIHFHEVGAVDAIVDIVTASAGIHALGVDAWYASPLNVGGGTVECAHGRFPVPAPATADLLRGMPTYSAHIEQELVTPTGAALLRVISPTFRAQPPMQVDRIGYGAGSRNPKGFPNALRLMVGDTAGEKEDTIVILETALDDLSPQIVAYVTEQAFAEGALDVMSMSVQMKKGRLGTLVTLLCSEDKSETLQKLLLRETSTLGVRIRREQRSCLERSHVTVSTPYGDIRIKIGTRAGEILNASPEFEDCKALAKAKNVPLKTVHQAAIAAYQSSVQGVPQ
jgi:pyridinium-3,5-bisthiocarboxylic acid mononucleotide nickel chelatase